MPSTTSAFLRLAKGETDSSRPSDTSLTSMAMLLNGTRPMMVISLVMWLTIPSRSPRSDLTCHLER